MTTGGERFAIPYLPWSWYVWRASRLDRHRTTHGAEVHRLRGNLLPWCSTSASWRCPRTDRASDVTNIVVLAADDRPFGLVVDEINDTEEIVVKPLAKQLKGLSVFAGATIMGDGRVALILDVLGIAQRGNVVSELHDRSRSDGHDAASSSDTDRESLLLVSVGEHGRCAIPLSLVARLEEVAANTIERAGADEVVQYRGHILPLFRLSQLLPECGAANDQDLLQVVVYTESDRSVGLVVDQIVDIIDESVVLERRSNRPGVRGSAVIQGRVTDLLDVQWIIRTADPSFFEAAAA
ncbi:MAG: chemotaxis protein CheW [Candidatus Eisenbacteria bacterium]